MMLLVITTSFCPKISYCVCYGQSKHFPSPFFIQQFPCTLHGYKLRPIFSFVPSLMVKPQNQSVKYAGFPGSNMEDDTRFLILHGCKLARDLQSNLPLLLSSGRSGSTKTTCEEIVHVFKAVADMLATKGREFNKKRCFALEGGMEIMKGGGLAINANISDSMPKGDGDRLVLLHPHKRRSRRCGSGEAERTIQRVPAPQFGNTNMPEEDGHTWRKYGQKIILGSKFPRGYYRCTHRRLYQCPAKKQVQRLDHDPNTFQITYQGQHTCLMSSTAPLLPLPPPPLSDPDNHQPRTPPFLMQLHRIPTTTSMAKASVFEGVDSIFSSKEDMPDTLNKKG